MEPSQEESGEREVTIEPVQLDKWGAPMTPVGTMFETKFTDPETGTVYIVRQRVTERIDEDTCILKTISVHRTDLIKRNSNPD